MGKTEVYIESIRHHLENNQQVVILRQTGKDRFLPIWLGDAEAQTIVRKQVNMVSSIPTIHDAYLETVRALGGNIKEAIISQINDEKFFLAKITVSTGDKSIEVDCRPSDAISIAQRANVKIFVDDDLLAKYGVNGATNSEQTK